MATKSIRLTDGTDTLLPESATSASGYQKNADGTLICWGMVDITIGANSSTGATVTFPVAFTSNPTIALARVGHVPNVTSEAFESLSTTGVTLRASNTYSSSISTTLSWIAIGRWK